MRSSSYTIVIRLSSNLQLLVLGVLTYLLLMIFILEKTGLTPPIPSLVYRGYLMVLALIFLWWPFDLLLHWEKRTPASFEKDKYIAMLAGTVILFVFPYYWLGAPLWPTLGSAVLIGLVIPGAWIGFSRKRSRKVVVQPETIYEIGMKSPRAAEFLKYFPDARIYVHGLTEAEGSRSHLVLHARRPCNEVPGAQLDYVMDIGVERRIGIYIGGKEQLQCYFFINGGDYARVGFLPSSNIGRALDYGFSEEEFVHAIDEANQAEQRWTPIGDKPLLLAHYPGRVVRIR